MQIKPTVGRVVWYYPQADNTPPGLARPADGQPLAAIIASVHSDEVVNLTVLDALGNPHSCCLVALLQDGHEAPVIGGYATWMPYQLEQAKRQSVVTSERAAAPIADLVSKIGMDFGTALGRLKAGARIARQGWSDMWIALGHGAANLAAEQFWNAHARAYAEQNGGAATVTPYVLMKTPAGEIQMGWHADQDDILAEDWIELTAA